MLPGAPLLVALALLGCGGASRSAHDHPAAASETVVAAPTLAPPPPLGLDAGWRYRADPGDAGLARDWANLPVQGAVWAPVTLPDDFNPDVDPRSDRGSVGWYATTFTGPPAVAGRSWAVAFEGVRRHAVVWLNGMRLGGSSDPYAPFSLPARSLLPGRPNRLLVRVDNIKGPGSLPEDWWNWGGITGPVTLQPVGRMSLAQLGELGQLGCQLRCASLQLRGTLRNDTGARLRPEVVVRLSAPGGAPNTVLRHRFSSVAPHGTVPIDFTVPVRGRPALWSPASPSLYRVQVDLEAGGRVEQRELLQTGLRSVAVRGGRLYLNGRRLWLHGAAIHEDIAGRGAALSDGDIDTIVSQLRSVGANITRAHYLLSPRLLDALDAAGIMVWAQPPVDHADAALATAAGRSRALAFLRSTLIGDRSHPSVVVNSVGNELTPNPDAVPGTRAYLRQASAVSRLLDPGIPVALDTYCYPGFPAQRSYAQLDVLGISSYFGWYRGPPGHRIGSFAQLVPFLARTHRRYARQALVIAEFGAEGLFNGPAALKGTLQFQSDYLRRTLTTIARLPFMNGSIYWTLREFAVAPGWTGGAQLPPGAPPDGIHHKGLIAYDGVQKPAYTMAEKLFDVLPPFAR